MSRIEDAEKDYLAGMKYKDIAEKYGVSLNTVKSWKSRNGWQRDATKKKGAHKKAKRVHTKKSKVAQARSPDVIDELVGNDELKDRQKAFCLYYLQRYNATIISIKSPDFAFLNWIPPKITIFPLFERTRYASSNHFDAHSI